MITPSSDTALGLTFQDVLLVPRRSAARTRKMVDFSSRLSRNIPLRVPIVSSNVDFCTYAEMAIAMALFGGIGILHRVNTVAEQIAAVYATKNHSFNKDQHPNATLDRRGRLRVGAAIGIIGDYKERAKALVEAETDVLVVDVAHGHSEGVIETVAELKAHYPHVDVIAGNVATAQGTLDLIAAGADAVKVGIGPGGVCTTRLVAGAGVPQVSAIINCAAAARDHNVPIIADGGIRQIGDVSKALACGASTVMLGSALAGSEESCAILVEKGGKKFKITTGEASLGMKIMLKKRCNQSVSQDEIDEYVAEGTEATYPYTGPVKKTLLQFVGGLRSGMSYSGALTIEELWKNAELCRVTPLGLRENEPHAAHGIPVPQLTPDYRNPSKELADAVQGNFGNTR